MKIGVISNLYPPFCIGGYERLCGDVCEGLTSIGHEVVVLTSDYGGDAPNLPGQTVDRSLRLLANYDNIYVAPDLTSEQRQRVVEGNKRSAAAFVTRHSPDVLFAWNLYFLDPDFLDHLSALQPRLSMFLTDNWLIAAKRGDRIGAFFQRFVHGSEQFEARGFDGAGDTLAIPQRVIFGARFVENLYRFCGFDTPNSNVIHNGVRLPMMAPNLVVDRSALRSQAGLKLLFAGRVVDIKGPDLAIASLPAIRAALPPRFSLTLNIVGDRQDHPFINRLHEQIASLGCEDMVRFVDPVPEVALPSLFNDHDIFIFPSLYEPFSLTLIHAMAAGIPTVASDVGGNREIVVPGRTGLLFDKRDPQTLAEAVLELVERPALRIHVSAGARHVAQRFTFQRMIDRIEVDLSNLAAS